MILIYYVALREPEQDNQVGLLSEFFRKNAQSLKTLHQNNTAMSLIRELEKASTFRPVFENLRRKAKVNPHILKTAPLAPKMSLAWILKSENQVIDYITKNIKAGKILSKAAKRNLLRLDKPRFVYSTAWPEKILQAAVVSLINNKIEQRWSNRLYSFRKGYSSHKAIRELSDFIKLSIKQNRSLYVLKRDVKNYDQSINKSKLMQFFQDELAGQQPFFWELIESFLKPEIINADEGISFNETSASIQSKDSLPMGFSITCLAENLYLKSLDQALDNQDGLFYLRYCDDIIIAHHNDKILLQNLKNAEKIISSLDLTFNEAKKSNILLGKKVEIDTGIFKVKNHVHYLGMNVYDDGSIFISDRKLRELKRHITRCVAISSSTTKKYRLSIDQRISTIISSVNLLFAAGLSHPYLELIIKFADNKKKIKSLDVWVARQILKPIFKGSHDKVFRKVSYKKLRELGLISLCHLRNIAYRGK